MRIPLISIAIMSATVMFGQQVKNPASRPSKHPEHSAAVKARKSSGSASAYTHKRESSMNQELAKIERENIKAQPHPAPTTRQAQASTKTRPSTPATQDKNKKINYSYHPPSQASKKPR